MSLADTLFGSPPTTTYNTTAGTKPPGYGFANQFFNSLQNIASNPFPTYGGSLDPGLSPTLQDLIQRAQGYASSSPPSILQGAAGTMGRLMSPNLSNPITRMFGGAPDLTGRLDPNQKVFGGGPAGGMGMPGTQTTPYGNDAMSVPWAHGGSGVQSMNGGGYQSGGPPQFGGGGGWQDPGFSYGNDAQMRPMGRPGMQSMQADQPTGGPQSMSGGGYQGPMQSTSAPGQFGGGGAMAKPAFRPGGMGGGYQTPGINPMGGGGFPTGRMPMMPPSPSSQMPSPTPWSAFGSPVSVPQQPPYDAFYQSGGVPQQPGGDYQPGMPGPTSPYANGNGGGYQGNPNAGGAPSPFGGSGSGSGPGMGTGTAAMNFNPAVGNNTTGNGGMGNLVQGLGQSAHDMGAMNNYGQLDSTGRNIWMNAGGGGQGKWTPFNGSDPIQSGINQMFNRYGSGWYSGNPTATGHSTDMQGWWQALHPGEQGTQQDYQDMYMNTSGQQQAGHDAFANLSAAYNPASSSYNPSAAQNLTSLNPLAHQ